MAKTKRQLIKKQAQIAKADQAHWTERTVDDFVARIAFDFITQIDNELERSKTSHADLAERLKVTKGRVSQVINDPANISLKNVVKYARAVDQKVALVLYNDADPSNSHGPVNSEIFTQCWYGVGSPRDFFQLNSLSSTVSISFEFNFLQWTGNYGAIDAGNEWLPSTSPGSIVAANNNTMTVLRASGTVTAQLWPERLSLQGTSHA